MNTANGMSRGMGTWLFPRALRSTRFFCVTRRGTRSTAILRRRPAVSRAHSSIGQSSRLITGLVLVRIQVGPHESFVELEPPGVRPSGANERPLGSVDPSGGEGANG